MNVVELIELEAVKSPNKPCVIFPQGEQTFSYTYKELLEKCQILSEEFSNQGITKGAKVLLFVKPSLNFSVITFSLFKLGAVPVFIDPGMGLKNLLSCTKKAKATFFISEKKGIILKLFFGSSFQFVKKIFCTKKFLSFSSIEKIVAKERTQEKFSVCYPILNEEDPASIIFTSGGTGRPKGVLYTHGMFAAQTSLLRKQFSYTDKDRDLPGFPLFSMMTIAMGVTSVIPEMDPSKPAACEPEKIVKNIQDHQVTTMAGSPAIWERVGLYCKENKIKLLSVRALIMFGAPIPKRLHELYEDILPNGTSYTPYGATECLPVSNISWKELKEAHLPKEFLYKAICIGKISLPTQVKVIKEESSHPLLIDNIKELSAYELGEIIVKGSQASPSYLDEEAASQNSKIKDGNSFWHRMGDLGFMDSERRLWFCGRVAHKVTSTNSEKENYSIPTELIFNDHPEIKKTALIALKQNGEVKPALVIERHDKKTSLKKSEKLIFLNELKNRSSSSEDTKDIHQFFLYKSLPVDKRHNIKIDRKFLSEHFSKKVESCL